MVITTIQAYIPLYIDTVFNHVANLENMVEYNSSIISSLKSESKLEGLPSYKIEVDLGIKKFKSYYTVLEINPNHKIVAYCENSDMKFTDVYVFKEEQGLTYFEITDSIELKGVLAWSEIILGPIMKQQMNQNLKSLLEILKNRYPNEWKI